MPLLGNSGIYNKSTPTTSKVRQAFKSPFRTPQQVQNQSTPKNEGIPCHDKNNTSIENNPKELENNYEILNITPKDQAIQNPSSNINDSRTPKRKLNSPNVGSLRKFKTPFRSPTLTQTTQLQSISSEEHLNQLREKEAMLDTEIEALKNEGFKVEELQGHIAALHCYNETKDAAQMVLGKLAEMEGITCAEVHKQYDLPTIE